MDKWEEKELSAAVDAYLDMLSAGPDSRQIRKTAVYSELAQRFGRSPKSYEYRMQNISSVMEDLGLPWVAGLKPARNVGANVRAELTAILAAKGYRKGPTPSRTTASHDIPGHLGPSSPTVQDPELALQAIALQLNHSSEFDPKDDGDGRIRTLSNIVRRRGQPKFRQALLEAYDGRCSFTGTTIESVLEAAHIKAYRGEHTNHITNGLLLRADVHTLFDLGLVSVKATTLATVVKDTLLDSYYGALEGKQIHLPVKADQGPNLEALESHYTRHFGRPSR